jgi:hypothetical protein
VPNDPAFLRRVCGRLVPLALVGSAFLCAFLGFTAASAGAYRFGPGIEPAGGEQMLFDWTTDRCESDDIPDLPARAFRDYTGKTEFLTTHWVNHRNVGFDLNKVKHDCSRMIQSHQNANPSAYDDVQWVASPYTLDGKNVFALMHTEYRGWTHPDQCDPNLQGFELLACAYYAIAFSRSTDGGKTFTRRPAPADLAATTPYRYVASSGQAGPIQPSNIVYRPDGFYYAMFGMNPYGDQPRGTCLMRTRMLADPTSWRAWDGSGFSVRFIDPYVETSEPPQAHICQPVSPENLSEQMSASLTYNTYFGKYMVAGGGFGPDPQSGAQIQGFWYSLSDDLIHWDSPHLLMEGQLLFTHECGQPDPLQYPSILDPTSPERNYGTTGQRIYLYYTRMHMYYYPGGCSLSDDRDLLRVPITLTGARGPTSLPDCGRVKAKPSVIGDPDNRWALVTVQDPWDRESVEITGVTQDEPTNSVATARRGTTPDTVRVRAQRSSTGDGRVYRISFIATGGNNTCWGTVNVGVPRTGTAVESNAYYNALNPPGA